MAYESHRFVEQLYVLGYTNCTLLWWNFKTIWNEGMRAMLEKLRYDLRNDTDVQKSTEMSNLSSKNEKGLNSNNELHAKVDGYQKSLSEKEEIIQQLKSQVDKSNHTLFVYYQKSLSERDEIIQQLTEQADRKK